MFSHIYTGMFLSVLLAALLSYALYSLSWQERRSNYEHQALQGVMQLVTDELQRQPPRNRTRYLDVVARLLGAGIKTVDRQQWLSTNKDSKQIPASGKAFNLTGKWGAVGITWLLVADENMLAEVSIAELSEQQFRALALLLVTELSRKNRISTPEQLSAYSPAPLNISSPGALLLDAQQLARLQRGGVVVDYAAESGRNSSFSVHALLAKDKVLVLGPVPQFNSLPIGIVLGMLAITGLSIVAIAYGLVSRLARRLKQISQMVRGFGEGDLQARVNISGRDSVADLGHRVNAMAERIEGLLQSQRDIMQAVSHELRTPLARIRFRLGILEEEQAAAAVSPKIEAIRHDLSELEQLIDEVLEHHKLNQLPELVMTDVDINTLINRVVTRLTGLYPNVRIKQQIAQNTKLSADETLLERLLSNLISNACKYGNSQVMISVEYQQGHCQLLVDDDGNGITTSEHDKVFTPFYRADGSRNKKLGGYGLGLAIVARITALHAADVTIQTSPMGGARLRIIFPDATNVLPT